MPTTPDARTPAPRTPFVNSAGAGSPGGPNVTLPVAPVLVIGATGGFGMAVTQCLLAHGWPVRTLTRRADMAQAVQLAESPWAGLRGVQWVQGDALDASAVTRAAKGVRFIVHGFNPPGYRHWREQALPALRHAMAAAQGEGARLCLPGNVYNFGPDAGTLLQEDAPQHPQTRKGQVRAEMEALLQAAARDPVRPMRSLVVRAGDFFGPHAPASWFGILMVRPGQQPLRRVVYPGRPEVGHAWAYLPDLAETLVRLMRLDLLQPDRLALAERVHLRGHWLPRGIEMVEAIRRVAGQPDLPCKPVPWPLMDLLSPVVPVLREVREMRYLWRVPIQLEGTRLQALIGPEPHTPLDEAVRVSLQGLACLPHLCQPSQACEA